MQPSVLRRPGAICPPVPDLAGGQGQVNAFAAIAGIPGESNNARHRNEIDLVSLSWCVTNSGSAVITLERGGPQPLAFLGRRAPGRPGHPGECRLAGQPARRGGLALVRRPV
jgi:hypothetical protein